MRGAIIDGHPDTLLLEGPQDLIPLGGIDPDGKEMMALLDSRDQGRQVQAGAA